jgi:hypothetical protein
VPPGDDLEPCLAPHPSLRQPVELEHLRVRAPHDQQRRRGHELERLRREVGPAAARDDGSHLPPEVRGGNEGRGRPGARSEERDRQSRDVGIGAQPPDRPLEPSREERDIEDLAAIECLHVGQQIEQQRRETCAPQTFGDRHVPRRPPA